MDRTMNPANGTTPELQRECRACLLGQALRTAREAGLSESEQSRMVERTARLMDPPYPPRSMQHLGRRITDEVLAICGLAPDFDIYREPKSMSNRLARTHVARLREAIACAEDPLSMAVRIAAAGNVIDFGAKDHATLDIEGELERVTRQPFERFELQAFRERLATSQSLLYICDNAGEIVFDALLMETLLALFPALSIQAAFRDAPILNDATVDDALAVGIDAYADVVSSGCRLAGCMLDECSAEFRHRYETANLILSKGQGNLSGLSNDADPRVFFVFRTKCAPVARKSGTTQGNLQMIQGIKMFYTP
jgi:damage-control phosphatase, subfamily I